MDPRSLLDQQVAALTPEEILSRRAEKERERERHRTHRERRDREHEPDAANHRSES